MKNPIAMCVYCEGLIMDNQPVFRIRRVINTYHEKDMVIHSPCCSRRCAELARAENIQSVNSRYKKAMDILMSEPAVKEMTLKEFLPRDED